MASTVPLRMASSVSSAVARRARNSVSSESRLRRGFVRIFVFIECQTVWVEIQPAQNLFGLRQVTDKSSQGKRQMPDESRGGDDLLFLGQGRLLVNVNDFQLIGAPKVGFAYGLQV